MKHETTQCDTAKDGLFRHRWIANICRSRYFPLTFQTLTFLIFSWALYDGFFGKQSAAENFATLAVSSLIFPIILIPTLLLIGRIWCAACPIGAINGATERFGLRKVFPKRLRKPSLILSLAFFILVVWAFEPQLGTRSIPFSVAIFLTIGAAGAAVIGLLFKGRPFCRYLCPLTVPLSLYSRLSAVEIRSDKELCRRCGTKDCYNGNKDVEGCPMDLFPGSMTKAADCIYCMKCIKACPHGSVKLYARRPGSELLTNPASTIEGFAALALVGIFPIMMTFMSVKGTVFDRPLEVISNASRGVLNWGFAPDAVHTVSTLLGVTYAITLFSIAALISARVLTISFKRSFSIFSTPYALFPFIGNLGHMTFQSLLGSFGQPLTYFADTLGIHFYHSPNLIDRSTLAVLNTTWSWLYNGAVLSIVAIIIYVAARKVNKERGLMATLPHIIILIIIAVIIYSQRFFPISI